MKKLLSASALAAAALVLSACTASTGSAAVSPTASEQVSQAEVAEQSVTVTDPWVKATEEGMTAAFAQFTNTTDQDLHAVSATSDQSDRTELHEMISQGGDMVMSQMPDGFTIPAGATYTLEPGGDHIMLMDLTAPIEAGQDVELTLEFSDGTSVSWTAPARVYDGANESYEGDGDMQDDMSDQSEDADS